MTASIDRAAVITPSPRRFGPAFRRAVPLLVGSTLALVVITFWQIASTSGWVSPVFLPPPSAVLVALGRLIQTGYVDSTLLQHTGASLGRIFSALAFSIAIGVPAGLLIATSPIGRGILDPIIEFLRPTGIPILGDNFYPEFYDVADDDYSTPLQLLARSIEFRDPFSGEQRRFESNRRLRLPI